MKQLKLNYSNPCWEGGIFMKTWKTLIDKEDWLVGMRIMNVGLYSMADYVLAELQSKKQAKVEITLFDNQGEEKVKTVQLNAKRIKEAMEWVRASNDPETGESPKAIKFNYFDGRARTFFVREDELKRSLKDTIDINEQGEMTNEKECSDCGGTGLYITPTCYNGTATICQRCEGSGCIENSYKPFTGRKRIDGITRVFLPKKYADFYPEDHTFENGKTVHYSQFGCTYEEWEKGETPLPWTEDTSPV